MNSKIKLGLTYLLLVVSVAILSGCETLPPAKSNSIVNAIPNNMVAATTATKKPKRIIPQKMTIEYVTCDPVRAKQLQAEIDARAAKRRQAMQASTS